MDASGFRNALLRQLTSAEIDRLRPSMEEVALEFKQTLYEQDRPVLDLYFPNSGVCSLITVLNGGEQVEAGTVGNEGLVGVTAVLGADRAPGRAICQIPGHAVRLPIAAVQAERGRRDSRLIDLVLRYTNFLLMMLGQTAACNRLHTVDARMARWLLMTHDRVDGDEFPMTQEFLAQMLGVQRPTVNIAGATLQRAGMIRYMRGRITITDRESLESAACECYAHLRKHLAESLGLRTATFPRRALG